MEDGKPAVLEHPHTGCLVILIAGLTALGLALVAAWGFQSGDERRKPLLVLAAIIWVVGSIWAGVIESRVRSSEE